MNGPVMVALAGTAASETALPVAMRVARALGAGLHLVRVFDVPQDAITTSSGLVGAFDAARDLAAEMEAALERTADRVDAAGFDVTVSLLPRDDVPRALLAESRRVDASVLVMATHARGAIGRALLGSVTDRVMKETDRPIVLVPPSAVSSALPEVADRELQRVLVPLGNSPGAERAAEVLLGLPHREQLEVVLLHAEGGAPGTRGAHAETAAVAERLARVGIRTEARTVTTRSTDARAVADAITAAAQETDADLIAMTTCWRTGLARLGHHCTADAVVRTATRPVLLVRAQA